MKRNTSVSLQPTVHVQDVQRRSDTCHSGPPHVVAKRGSASGCSCVRIRFERLFAGYEQLLTPGRRRGHARFQRDCFREAQRLSTSWIHIVLLCETSPHSRPRSVTPPELGVLLGISRVRHLSRAEKGRPQDLRKAKGRKVPQRRLLLPPWTCDFLAACVRVHSW